MSNANRLDTMRKTVTLNVTGNWQPTTNETGKTAEFTALASQYVVDAFTAYEHTCSVVVFHGLWTNEEDAQRFAASCGDARVRRVSPYWYVPHFGMVGSLTLKEHYPPNGNPYDYITAD